MKTKITVLVDNIPGEKLKGEWGLSLLVEYGDKKILADVGASKLFAENMKKLGFDIEDVDLATLSHGHCDHANGMIRFFRDNRSAKFYLQETTGENCYVGRWCFYFYAGLPRRVLKKHSDRIVYASGDYSVCEGVWLIPHRTPGLEAIGKREKMYQRHGRQMIPDNFSHEQSLVLETDRGLVVINCCSHGGVVNIIREVQDVFPDRQIYGVIGGFHLFNKSEQEVRQVAAQLRETGVEFICTGHCTGQEAYDTLAEELGDRMHQLHVGMEMDFS